MATGLFVENNITYILYIYLLLVHLTRFFIFFVSFCFIQIQLFVQLNTFIFIKLKRDLFKLISFILFYQEFNLYFTFKLFKNRYQFRNLKKYF